MQNMSAAKWDSKYIENLSLNLMVNSGIQYLVECWISLSK